MPKTDLDGLPVNDVDESEEVTVEVSADDIQVGGTKNLNSTRLRLLAPKTRRG